VGRWNTSTYVGTCLLALLGVDLCEADSITADLVAGAGLGSIAVGLAVTKVGRLVRDAVIVGRLEPLGKVVTVVALGALGMTPVGVRVASRVLLALHDGRRWAAEDRLETRSKSKKGKESHVVDVNFRESEL